jgi:hypothetical protein
MQIMQTRTETCRPHSRRARRRRPATLCAVVLAAVLSLAPVASGADDGTRMTLRHEPRAILDTVARSMNVTLRADEPLPEIHFESRTSLARFQDAVAPQWRFRPPMIANVYVVARNEIYLIDDPQYYRRMQRTLDESLAHEYAHYLQVRYFGADLSDETCETAAVAAQFAFREHHLARSPGVGPG